MTPGSTTPGSARCGRPLSLKVGQIDEQFRVDTATLKNAAQLAADEWNSATGETLLVICDDGEVTINLLFDGRQDSINKLSAEEQNMSAASDLLKEPIQKHEEAVKAIESAALRWNEETSQHNQRIDALNARSALGFDDPNEYAAFEAQRARLSLIGDRLKETQQQLTRDSPTINRNSRMLKEEGETLNNRIRSLKERFPPNVFTEGEHRRGPAVNEINLYTFYNLRELHAVLLHEMGHVLGLPHTDERPAIMYLLLEHGSDPYHLPPPLESRVHQRGRHQRRRNARSNRGVGSYRYLTAITLVRPCMY